MRLVKMTFVVLMFASSLAATAQKEPVETAKGNQIEIQTSAICEMCQHAIEYDLAFVRGVKNAELNLDNKVVTVLYNPKKITPEEIRTSITKVGYHADFMARDSIAYSKLPFCCKDGNHGTPEVQVPTKKKDN
ncbi:MAG: heavy metal-associated domain-containing protein [Cyclobacteriaceae bacterium]